MNRGFPQQGGARPGFQGSRPAQLYGILFFYKIPSRPGAGFIPVSPTGVARAVRLLRLARINPAINVAWLIYDTWNFLFGPINWSQLTPWDHLQNWKAQECAPCGITAVFQNRWKDGYVGGCYCFPYPFLTGNPMPIGVGPYAAPKILEFVWWSSSNNSSWARRIWSNTSGDPQALMLPVYGPQFLPAIVPDLPNWLDPDAMPIAVPVTDPLPPPWPEIPKRAPSRLPQGLRRGYGPPARRRLRPFERPQEGIEVEVKPKSVTIRQQTGPHLLVKPGHNVKEVKKKVSKVFGFLLKSVGAITEGMDAINAIWKAIPFEKRPRGFQGPLEKARFIYDNFPLIVWDDAITNLIVDQIQDTLIAMGARQRQQAMADLGVPAGTANADTWISKQVPPKTRNPLEAWLTSRVNELVNELSSTAGRG